jgi:hypothetical protein
MCNTKLILKHGNDPDSRFNRVQLRIGTRIEREHTGSPAVAKAIAKAHLSERKDYYKRLRKAGL